MDLLEENSPIVAPKISHILFIYCDFIFLLHFPILKLEWLKNLNFEGPLFLVPKVFVKFYFSLIFACIF